MPRFITRSETSYISTRGDISLLCMYAYILFLKNFLVLLIKYFPFIKFYKRQICVKKFSYENYFVYTG